MRKQVIYYNENGQFDRLTTFINNHNWVMPVVVILGIIITGIVEAL